MIHFFFSNYPIVAPNETCERRGGAGAEIGTENEYFKCSKWQITLTICKKRYYYLR